MRVIPPNGYRPPYPGVRSFVGKWRTGEDSNPDPQICSLSLRRPHEAARARTVMHNPLSAWLSALGPSVSARKRGHPKAGSKFR